MRLRTSGMTGIEQAKEFSQKNGLRSTDGVSSDMSISLFGGVTLAEVRVQEGESIENALRRFKRKVQTEEIIREVKRHSFYLKPGAKRRVKQALARKRARKKTRREPD
jgi:small subunit ribosomal protein S21